MGARSEAKAQAAIKELEQATGRAAIFLKLDLADFASIKQAAAEFTAKESQLNTLFNSACVSNSTSAVILHVYTPLGELAGLL